MTDDIKLPLIGAAVLLCALIGLAVWFGKKLVFACIVVMVCFLTSLGLWIQSYHGSYVGIVSQRQSGTSAVTKFTNLYSQDGGIAVRWGDNVMDPSKVRDGRWIEIRGQRGRYPYSAYVPYGVVPPKGYSATPPTTTSLWYKAGFQSEKYHFHWVFISRHEPTFPSTRESGAYIVFPWWLLSMVTGAVTGIVAFAAFRRVMVARRSRRGLCPYCGYDLRASSGRCPECGAMFESPVGVSKV